jgi:hypothetical protein
MRTRRNFLRSAGALTTLGTAGLVGARTESTTPSIEEVNQAFHDGMMAGGASGARRALEDLDLDPKVDATRDFQMGEKKDAGTVTPQLHYGGPKDSDSELVVGLSNAPGPDNVYMTVAMFLDSPADSVRHAMYCPDAIGIGFNQKHWAAMGEPSIEATNRHDARFTAHDVAKDALAGTVKLRDQYDGRPPALPSERFPPSGITLTGEFRLMDGGVPSQLWGSYTHTWALKPSSTIKSISGGKGGLGVEVAFGASKCWSLAKPSDPRDHV